MKISVDSFRGLAPKLAPALLPNFGAQVASNIRMNSGSLIPVNSPKLESNKIIANAISVSMIGAPGSAVPMSWTTDVDVAPSPVADTEYKVYYTGDGLPKKTTFSMAGSGGGPYPTSWYLWSTPAPTTAPTLGSTTGSVPAGNYAYVFTYVTQFGAVLLEETQPSPAGTITLGATGGVTVTFPANPSTTNRNYVYKRVYRTTGSAYQLVAQVPFANASFTDNLASTAILGDSLITADFLPIKDDLIGVTTLPGGVMVGFRNNEVWFSEPGYPHAWPLKYMQTVDSPIIGLKSYGNTVVLATQTYPQVASGLHPSSFTFRKLPLLEPCLSKRSLASDEQGVLYASANGLVSIGDGGYSLASANYISRESFTAYNPASFTAAVYEGRYYGFYSGATLGSGALVFSRDAEAPISTLSLIANGATIDPKTSRLLFINSTDGLLYNHDPVDTVPFTYNWKSKLFMMPAAGNLGCFRLIASELSASDAAFIASINAQNAVINASNATAFASGVLKSEFNSTELNSMALNDSVLQALIPSVDQKVGVTIWAGREIIWAGDVNLNQVYRLPSGFRNLSWEIGVAGQREVYAVQMATTPDELGVVGA